MSKKETKKMSKEEFGVPEINPDEIEMEQLIGEGTYGQVFSGRCRGKEVAVKG